MVKAPEGRDQWSGWLFRTSLSRRIALTMILSLVAIQAQAFLQIRLFSDPEIRLTGARWLADQTNDVISRLLSEPVATRTEAAASLSKETGLKLSWTTTKPDLGPDESLTPLAARLAATLQRKLSDNAKQVHVSASRLNYRFPMNTVRVTIEPAAVQSQLGTGPIVEGEPEVLVPAGSRIWIELPDGTWAGVERIGFSDGAWGSNLPFAPLLAGGIIIALVSTFLARRLVAPLDRLVQAADRVAIARDPVQVDRTGLYEFAGVARAFEDMQQRLLKYVDDRTQMLAAISHDLRTSLTRLRLAAEPFAANDDRSALLTEIADMQSMVESTLAFASGEARMAPNQVTDIAAILISIADEESDAGRRCGYDGPDHIESLAHPTSLKRAFRNIVDNALKYGTAAHIRLAVNPEALVITVDDDGPGIPDNQHENVFAPFRRLDPARGSEVSGAGLGLTIARDVVQSHGGTIELQNRGGSGLTVKVTLPRR